MADKKIDKAQKVFALDASQETAVTIDKNAVVSAGAGSGKTRVLAERFAHLVINKKIKVDEILTLTFTKKAAAEMYGRIYKTLKAAGASNGAAAKAAAEFHKAHIQTIDSYCASVAKMGAHFYGISPDFTEDEDAAQKIASDMALPFLLKHRSSEAIKELVKTKKIADLAEELFTAALEHSTICEPIDFDKTLELQKATVQNEWKRESQKALEIIADIKNLLADILKPTATIENLRAAYESFDFKKCVKTDEIGESEFNNSNSERLETFIEELRKISALPLPRGKDAASVSLNETIKALRKISGGTASNLTKEPGTLIPLANYVSGFSTTYSAFSLLKEFQSLVNEAKRAAGVLNYADVASLALCTLRDNAEIRQFEKRKYKAIMIDEFQDNNSRQRDLLFLLAEKPDLCSRDIPRVEDLCDDKLFFVGDEKQSIYRFRGADVSVFRNLSKDFADGNLSLKTNYRSHPSLIAAFNTIFGGEEFPPAQNTAATAEVAAQQKINNISAGSPQQKINNFPSAFYTARTQNASVPDFEAIYRHVAIPDEKWKAALASTSKAFAPRIHIALYDKTQSESDNNENDNDSDSLADAQTEAKWVAQKIKTLVTEPQAENDGKPYRAGDIAILFRTYSPQPIFERALLDEGVPYNTETLTGFFNDGPTNDIFSFLRLVAYPDDSMAYETVLRSPFVNFSTDEANETLAAGEKAFESKIINLPKTSREHYENAKSLYRELCESAKTEPLVKIIDRLWYGAGYRYETLWNKKVQMYETLYDRIFELARRADMNAQSLASFVDGVRTYRDEKEKLEDMDIPLERADGVHLLTIHKSKGLEFPVVFLCSAHKKGQVDANNKALYYSERYGVSVNTPPCQKFLTKSNYFFNVAKEQNTAMMDAELRRLAYVALTRAENRAFITGIYESESEAFTFKDAVGFLPGGGKSVRTILNIFSPLIDYYSREENKARSPFTFETIPIMRRENAVQEGRANTTREKIALIKNAVPLYEKAVVIEKDFVPFPYTSPTKLHAADDETFQNGGFEFVAAAPYPEINAIVEASIPKAKAGESKNEPRFTFADFGTIAHAYMEAAITGNEAVIKNRDIVGLDGSEAKRATIQRVCEKMQVAFKESALGKEAAASSWRKTEYEFRFFVAGKIIRGTIDLVFKNSDGAYTIVDYKTNQTVQPELYYVQLACYRNVLAAMRGISQEHVRCVLYYLRFGETVDITADCANVDVEAAVRELMRKERLNAPLK